MQKQYAKAISINNKHLGTHENFLMEQGWGQVHVQLTNKYYASTPSTPNIYQIQVQVLVKYSFFKMYLSTSSTFISSTSTQARVQGGGVPRGLPPPPRN